MIINVKSIEHYNEARSQIMTIILVELYEEWGITLSFPKLEAAKGDTVALDMAAYINRETRLKVRVDMGAREYTIAILEIEPKEVTGVPSKNSEH